MGEHPAGAGGCLLTPAPSALDAFFAHFYARHPVTATFTGIHDYDGTLPDWSRAARRAEGKELDALRSSLRDEAPSAIAADPVRLDEALARANCDVRLAEFESGCFHDLNPALWTGEAIFGAVSLMIRDFAPIADRVPALCSRLEAVHGFLTTMRETLSEPIPQLWRVRAERECLAAIRLVNESVPAWLAESAHETAIDARTRARLSQACAAASDAFAESLGWLEQQPVADATRYACGERLFTQLLTRGHFCQDAPRTLLARAESQFNAETESLIQMSWEPYQGSWPAVQAALSADRPDVTEYYDTFTNRWNEIHAGVTAANVLNWPEWPIRYVPIPKWARDIQPALYWLFYRSPAPFDPYSVYEYVVTPIDDSMPIDVQDARLAAWNHSTITLNHVVHHGGAGHHVQNWNAIHRSSSRIGAVAAVDAASRVSMFLGGSLAEGWACYATTLVGELGLLTHLETLSEQHTNVRQLARAIVDIRLHLGDWTFNECVDFYVDRVGMTKAVATVEATKNSMFPATAIMYWLGTNGILELRQAMRQRLGTHFSLATFHDALLSRGAIPVPLIAQLMLAEAAT